uniref:Calcium release activated channel regulator 2Ab n=1 Tax=Oryzias sinensis TaxID=183150 RepID=A0A8C7ZDA6_9TELE
MEEEEGAAKAVEDSTERRGSDLGITALLSKTKEFFQTCDVEGKGFLTRLDMRRLHREVPLSAEQLEDVFDSLDMDHAGYLTLEAFSSRFSQFLHGRRISVTDDQHQASSPVLKTKEALYQSQWEAKLSGDEDEEERHFCMLLESLGAINVFEDPGEVRNLWTQFRRNEPHLLSNFEEFLARVTVQIKEAYQEKKEMESALQRKAATHDSEIRHLYEEMEAQIKTEKDRLLLMDSERLQLRSQDLEHQLRSKERELEYLFQKQKRLELQCNDLNSEKQESHVENLKLKMTNEELSKALECTGQELALAQEQLAMLQEQARRLRQEKDMEMYRVTEGLQREKQSLMRQLDLLREMNKHLKDERDVKPKSRKEAGKMTPKLMLRNGATQRSEMVKAGTAEEFMDALPEGWPLRRVISIEEDHLPHLLQDGPQPLLQLSEEDDVKAQSKTETPVAMATNTTLVNLSRHTGKPAEDASVKTSCFARGKKTPVSPRQQPVGKESQQVERTLFAPDRLFKVVLVGDSCVGKTSLLRSFCEGRFHPSSTTTVGIDYSVKTLTLDSMQIAMQLWDTAGQERYRSITKQFFRKADGVVVMFDVTLEESFKAVRPWLNNVQVGQSAPMMQYVTSHMGRSIKFLLFYLLPMVRLSPFTSHLWILIEQEDRVRDTTVTLTAAHPIKKKTCCK